MKTTNYYSAIAVHTMDMAQDATYKTPHQGEGLAKLQVRRRICFINTSIKDSMRCLRI
jgi:hypothetical protein